MSNSNERFYSFKVLGTVLVTREYSVYMKNPNPTEEELLRQASGVRPSQVLFTEEVSDFSYYKQVDNTSWPIEFGKFTPESIDRQELA